MSDEQLERAIGSFYKGTEETPPDPRLSAERIMTEVSDVRQVRRRWWRPARAAGAYAEPGLASAEYHATPLPATNGRSHHAHLPTAPGRTLSMLSPVKAITAGALVFALAGAFLIARPLDQPSPVAPAAEGDAVADAAWVSGTIIHAPGCTPPERIPFQGGVHEVGYRCESQIWESDDPRFTGRATPSWNADVYLVGDGISVTSGAYEIVTDAGSWQCTYGPEVFEGYGFSSNLRPVFPISCAGQDAYAGLRAVLDVHEADSFEGLVFAGELPPPPAAAGQ